MEKELLHIGIILGSTREGRVSPQVGTWLLHEATKRNDAHYDLIDIKDYDLPFLGTVNESKAVDQWNTKLKTLDGFIFIIPEYNHGITAALKNALDSAQDAWHNKAAGLVSYGSAYGARAAEQVRNILGELQVADVRTQVLLSLFTDFDNYTTFTPQNIHTKNITTMLDQVLAWSNALKPLR